MLRLTQARIGGRRVFVPFGRSFLGDDADSLRFGARVASSDLQKSFRGGRRKRGGIAAVEFAIIAPLLLMLVFGIIEFGRMLMVQQILTNASREGARRAIIEGATGGEVESMVSAYLTNASVSGANVTIEPMDLSGVGLGDPVSVTIAVPFEDVSWAGSAWFLGGSTLQASTIMQGERLQ